MALFSSTQPSLRARVLPRFPAQVRAGAGISIEKSGSVYTFSSSATATKLTADTTYYVDASTGSDSNDGLTPGNAWRTIQYASTFLTNNVDVGRFTLTLSLNGTFTEGGVFQNFGGSGFIVIDGNNTTAVTGPAVATGLLDVFVFAGGNLQVEIQNIALSNSVANGDLLHISQGAVVYVGPNIDFGSVIANQIDCDLLSIVFLEPPYTISGGGGAHIAATYGAVCLGSGTATLTGTPAFTNAFIYADTEGLANLTSMVWSGAATGRKFHYDTGARIFGTASLPGSIAGTGSIEVPDLVDAANDVAAAGGGVAIDQMYRNGSVLMVRVT